ncbi:uncharacterized protein LOC106179130 [Lingula anatina]|uniref:Uncharacterized protein LOC106179130 n=1 Tax=Lingula anatina TaxID=7574 RepID=A0A1S3K6Q9_LINAN|nr:uncharacterized protein LOC106179130 [Lingula anatina]|eukprot:XP_013418114.1 uncharacterized protein LOC106179130 [Lingula anatina]
MGKFLLLYFILVFIQSTEAGQFYYCPQVDVTEGPLRFTRELGNLDYSCTDNNKRLYCCAAGFQTLHWFKMENEKWISFPPPDQTGTCDVGCPYQLLRSNTTLAMKPPLQYRSGRYKCVISDDAGDQKQHEIELKVVECGNWNKPPAQMQPPKQRLTDGVLVHKRKHGQHVSFICEGFFGDPLGMFNDIRWQRKNKTSGHIREVTAWGPRYSVTETKREEDNILLANFTISDIEEGDYDDYMCRMSNGIGRGTEVKARLEYGEENPQMPFPIWICIVPATTLVLLLIIVSLIWVKYNLEFRLCYRSIKIRVLKEKDADADRHDDIYICTCPDSTNERQFAETILKEKLEKEGYSVRLDQDVLGFQSENREFTKAFDECRRYVILISPELLNPVPDYFDFFIDNALNQHTRIIFVIFGEINIDDWNRFAETQIKNCKNPQLLPKVLKMPFLNCLQYYPDAEREERPKSRWRYICKKSKRQKNERFWKKLQLCLPPPSEKKDPSGHDVVDGRRKDLSSESTERPLLEEDRPDPVPVDVGQTRIEVILDDEAEDDVFNEASDQNAVASNTGALGNHQGQGHMFQNQFSKESAYFSGSGSFQANSSEFPQKSPVQPMDAVGSALVEW